VDQERLAAALGRNELFTGADATTLAELGRRCRLQAHRSGTTVIDQHDEDTDLFAILDGRVRITLLSSKGQEVSFRDQEPGTAFGLLSAIDGRPRSASAVALTDTRVAVVSGPLLKDTMARAPAVMDAVTHHLAFLVRELSERIFEFSTMVARQRVHAELLRLAERAEPAGGTGVLIRPAPTHVAIATRISTQRETVSREMSTLARMGLVERRSGGLLVRDVDALEALVEAAHERED
jgi:CRP-like cAMP-binding protein